MIIVGSLELEAAAEALRRRDRAGASLPVTGRQPQLWRPTRGPGE